MADRVWDEGLLSILSAMATAGDELVRENRELAEANLHLSKGLERYADRFLAEPVGSVETDNLGVIRHANLRAAVLFGFEDVNKLVGKPLSLFIGPDHLGAFREHLDQVNLGADLVGWEAQVLRVDGDRFIGEFNATGARSHGRPQVRWTIADVTSRRNAEDALRESRAQLDMLVSHLPAIVWTTDPALRITSMRSGLFHALGATEMDLDDRSAVPSIEEHLRGEVALAAHAQALAGAPASYDAHISGRLIEVDVAPLRDAGGLVNGCVGLGFDVTEREAVTQATRRALEREQEAVKSLEEVDNLRQAVLATISHDFASPLTAIIGMADLLERRLDLNEADRTHFANRISSQAIRLGQLLRDLVDVATMPNALATQRRELTDLVDLVEKIASVWNAESEAIFVEGRDVFAEVDPVLVERIIENLIGNAMKHTPEGTPVWVRVFESDAEASIYVDDAGPGVPEDLKEHIFEPFERGSSSSSTPGMGLGLHLVKRFTELHGGRVWVEDRPGGGASFRVALPRSGGRPPEPSSPGSAASS